MYVRHTGRVLPMIEDDVQMRMQGQSIMIKPKKFTRQPRSPVNVIKTFNKFTGLSTEDCNIVEQKDNSSYQGNITQEKYDVKHTDEIRISNKKSMKWRQFFDKNQFEVLIDNHEVGIKDIITRTVILKTPKHCLKKCKRCNFKKRTCVFKSSSCKAIQQWCFKCNKKGHYPQSPYCKANKRSKSTQESKEKRKMHKNLDSTLWK